VKTGKRDIPPTRLGEEYSVVERFPQRAPEVRGEPLLRARLEDVAAVRALESNAPDDGLLRRRGDWNDAK
jgi:hypothetical protein